MIYIAILVYFVIGFAFSSLLAEVRKSANDDDWTDLDFYLFIVLWPLPVIGGAVMYFCHVFWIAIRGTK